MEQLADEGALKHGALTRTILGCAMEVHSELGPGFLESVYHRALAISLEEAGLSAETEKPLLVRYKHYVVGTYYAYVVVAGCVLLELKAARCWAPEHEAQTIHYLKATGLEVALMINFGRSRLDFRRLIRNPGHDDESPDPSYP